MLHNNTEFTMEQIREMPFIGRTVNKWRQRNIILYEAPNKENVISVGTTFDNQMTVVAEEPRSCWAAALECIEHGEIYVSE